MALASILIPFFNRAHLVLRTIEPSRAQTLNNIKIIIVDNYSAEGTYEAAQAYLCQDPRIRASRNETNIGPVRNWLRCAELTTLTYCKPLFSDGLIPPTFLDKTIPHLIGNKTAFAYTPVICDRTKCNVALIYRALLSDRKFVRRFFLRPAMAVNYFSPVKPGAAIVRKIDVFNGLFESPSGVEGYDFSGNRRRAQPANLPRHSTAIRARCPRIQASRIFKRLRWMYKLRPAHPLRILARKAMAPTTC
jgi:glycosyltransferase involved in cell wall biosynthesis